MVFNNRLLRGVAPENHPLAKLILFTLEQDINLIAFTEPADVMVRPEYREHTNKIVATLLNNNSIAEDYDKEEGRLTPCFPLYVEEQSADFDVNELRNLWSHANIGEAGKMGDPHAIRETILKVMQLRGYDFQQMLKASKNYLENCQLQGRFIKDLQNFLYVPSTGEVPIAAFIEDGGAIEPLSDDVI